jgi:hypothetical protein
MSKASRILTHVAFPSDESEKLQAGFLATNPPEIVAACRAEANKCFKAAGSPKYVAMTRLTLTAWATQFFLAGAAYGRANPEEALSKEKVQ